MNSELQPGRDAPPSRLRNSAPMVWTACVCAVLACSSPAQRNSSTGGTDGEEETGGKKATGGSGGSSKTGGSGGSATGGSVGTGGSVATGGSGQTGGSGGSTGGSGGSTQPDAGPSDGPPATMAGCTGFAGKFCDDFDGEPKTGEYTLGAGITVDTTKPRSGTKSLHFKISGSSFMTFTKQFPINNLNGRMMFFMATTPSTNSHWDWLTAANPVNYWSVGGQYGKFELVCDPPDNGIDSATPFPSGKWVCLQWTFGYDPATKKTTFVTKIDGVPVDKGMFTGPKGNDWAAGPWRNLRLGYEVFGSGAAPEFWVDDFAFGEQEIPCPAP